MRTILRAEKPGKAALLPSGKWQELHAAWNCRILCFPVPLACYEPAVIRLS